VNGQGGLFVLPWLPGPTMMIPAADASKYFAASKDINFHGFVTR
jgi:hypothetical protein